MSYGLYRIQDMLPLKQNMGSLAQSMDKNGVINGGRQGAGDHRFPPGGQLFDKHGLAEL